jgi:ankyrin repeat protein
MVFLNALFITLTSIAMSTVKSMDMNYTETFFNHFAQTNNMTVEQLKDLRWSPLHCACLLSNTSVAEIILTKKADINAQTTDGKTPLQCAIENNCITTALWLISKCADVNTADNAGNTALYYAIDKENIELVEQLVMHDASILVQNANQETPLHAAISTGNNKISIYLLERGAQVNSADKDGYTPLDRAIDKSELVIIKYLLHNKADINCANKYNKATPLHIATWHGDLEIVAYLLKNFAAVNAKDKDNRTPLYAAVEKGHRKTISLLSCYGAEINTSDQKGITPLHWSILMDKANAAKQLLASNADVNQRYLATGRAPLHLATTIDNTTIIEHLCDHAADINAQDIQGRTPFFYIQSTKALECLLSYGLIIPLDEKNNPLIIIAQTQQKQLTQAAENQNFIQASTLLNQGAYCNAYAKVFIDRKRKELFNSVQKGETTADFIALLKQGFTLHTRDKQGNTLLHKAMAVGNLNIVKMLLNLLSNAQQLDIYLDKQNKLSQTPLELAIGHNKLGIITLLLDGR